MIQDSVHTLIEPYINIPEGLGTVRQVLAEIFPYPDGPHDFQVGCAALLGRNVLRLNRTGAGKT